MVKVTSGGECFYLDGYLKTNLDILIKAVHGDRDLLIIVDGREREGKSTIACQMAKYCDPTYSTERCCLTPEDFLVAVKKAKQYEAIVLDEGQGFTSRGAITKLNKALVKVLSEIAMKNLFLFICIPSFFELDRYPAIHRAQALIHIYSKELQRGRFCLWSYKLKKLLYFKGKKFYSYKYPKPNFYGVFTKAFPIDKKEYLAKKKKAIEKIVELEHTRGNKNTKIQRDALIRFLFEEGFKIKEIVEISEKYGSYPIDKGTIGKTVKDLKVKEPQKPL